MAERPIMGVTLGDPAGIGPEIVVRALCSEEVHAASRPVAIGDGAVLRRALAQSGSGASVGAVRSPEEARPAPDRIDFVDVPSPGLAGLPMGRIDAACGRAAFEAIRRAAELASTGSIDAVATAPIHKESLKAAGIPHAGHTEILAALTGAKDPLTLFAVRNLRVFFLTRHVSLRQACAMVTRERVFEAIVRSAAVLEQLGIERGPLAVAALNPHGGEHGLFGDEEVREIEPAVGEARARGIDVAGPIPADSVFHLALEGRYAAVLSLYHDQGHIACKTLDFERTVSITCGLPFLRTSPDHGTAFDIAGKGVASAVSMTEAILAAARLAPLFRAPGAPYSSLPR